MASCAASIRPPTSSASCAQEGATAIEYAIIASGIAGVLIATVTTLGGSVGNMWTAVSALFN